MGVTVDLATRGGRRSSLKLSRTCFSVRASRAQGCLPITRARLIALLSSVTLLKAPRRMRFRGGEEALNHVEPGSRGREARMGLEPALYGRRLVGGIVVDDQVEIETGRGSMMISLRKRRNSRCRWRGMQVPITLPSSILSAANRVAPAADSQQALVNRRSNPLRRQPIARQQHDPCSPDHFLRAVSVPEQPLQLFDRPC
jgi:hypothetical protein